jgi:hypothetical protein
MAKLLGVGTPRYWQRFCDTLQTNSIHAGIGRRLAFTYATARNTLFELLEPSIPSSLISNSPRAERVPAPIDELEEAKAILDSAPRCFEKVPFFEQNRSQMMGEFHLNVAQLRADSLPAIPSARRDQEIQGIQDELDRADRLLGGSKIESSVTVAELLLKVDPFQSDRSRLQRLREILATTLKSL